EFEQCAAEPAGHARSYDRTHPGRAGGTDERNPPVVGERFAQFSAAERNLAQAFRSLAELLHCPPEQRVAGQRAERRLVRWLPDDAVAADERQRGVPRPHRNREMPTGPSGCQVSSIL